jgi:chromosome segregation protein
VRLKDVNELLMDTGLGRDGYSIIGQGRIADIVSGRSEERREVLEEAAGISRYRYRKEESERKLKRTDENLLRINDKIDELQYQVGPLKAQAETAKRYLVLRDELRGMEVSLWMQTLDKLREQAETVNRDYEAAQSGLERAKKELEALYAKSEDLARLMREKDVQAEELRKKLSGTEAAAAECEAAAAVLRANMQNSAERVAQIRAQIADQAERAGEIGAQIAAKHARTGEIDARAKELEKDEAAARNVIEGRRLLISNREAESASLNDALTKQIIELRSTDSRIAMLTAMEKEYEGFGNAVKTVMREARHGALKGVRGAVAELIRADERCTLAIETALGAAIQNIVVETQADGRAAIELLKRKDCGRGTFLPLDTMRGGRLDRIPGEDEGCVGLAVDLVSFAPEYTDIIENLLGRTLVAETLSDAIAISRKNGNRLRIVTLDGQLIHSGGSMTGGSAAKGTGILSRANELERLNAGRGALSGKCDELAARAEKIKRELSAGKYELETAAEDLQVLLNEKASLAAERRTNEAAAAELERLRSGISGEMDSRAGDARDIEAGTDSFKKELTAKEARIAELNAAAEKIRADITAMTARKLEMEGQRTRADREVQEKNAALLDMERTCARFEQKKLAADMEEKQIIDKLWDGYQLSHSAAQAVRHPIDSTAQANRRIAELRREMNALGTPNLGAIDEYARVSERYEFLTSQRDDIEKARRELLGIIRNITEEMRTIFTREFAAINSSFAQTFSELFGGGRAELVLEDPEDVLGCDIDIRVQPQGKTLTTLSLLSGGEMAFVAIAMYFAIIRVRPTPFCVMDEIEAALDEANVIRFADYMRRLSSKTQFVVITHRRGTMEGSDELYGVTMQEKGVSRIIELDLAEAEKHIGEEN